MQGARTIRQLPLRHRAVLALLPGHLRDEHERELLLALTEDPGDTSWRALLADVLRAAPAAHWDVMRQDVRLALRQLHRAPSFALIAVITLSLGLGGNLVFFALVDGVLFRPLRLLGESELVSLTEENIPRGLRTFGVSPANFRDYTRDTTIFRTAAAYHVTSGTLRTGQTQDRVVTASVSGEFFRVFLERPALGRALQPADDVVGGDAVVVSHTFHAAVLGGDPGAVGREIELDGQRLRIVGVMPAGFAFPSPAVALWRPLAMTANDRQNRGARYVSAVARLRTGVGIAGAAAGVSRLAASLASTHPETNRGWTVLLRDLRSSQVDRARPQLYLVWAAGTLVLLVSVANVAGLFLARAVTRQREFAVRSALGARAGRVARQVASEALLLTSISALAGLGIASVVLYWLRESGAGAIPRVGEVALGWRTVVFACLLAAGSAAVLGLLAVPTVRQRDLRSTVTSGRAGASRSRWRLHRALVAGEVAFATFVLIGASLVARTLWGLLHQPMGFDANGVMTFRVEPPFRVDLNIPAERLFRELNADQQRVVASYRDLLDAIGELPGVLGAGAINRLPLTGEFWITSVGVPDRPSSSPDGRYPTWVRPVTSGYLETMRTRILRGRTIDAASAVGGERVVVIDEAFARKVWGSADPIGRAVVLDGPPGLVRRARIVGVAESVHMNRLDAEQAGTMYVPFAQSMEGFFPNWGMDVVVRSPNGLQQVAEFRRLVRDRFPDAVVFGLSTMDDLVTASVADRRFHLLVLGVFSVLALVLSTIGVGGALMLVVRERRSELAVRMALGARLGRVWWEVQVGGLTVAVTGAVAGSGAALAGAQLFSSLVHGIPVRDPVSYVAAPLLLCVAAFAAVAVPATRATKLNPSAVLRES